MKNTRKKAALIGGLAGLVAASSAGCMLSDPNDPNYMFHQQNQNPNYYQHPQPPEQAPGGVFVGGGSIFSAIGAYKQNPWAGAFGDSMINAGGALNGRAYVNRNSSYPREYIETDGSGNAWHIKDYGRGYSVRTPIGTRK